MDNYYRKTVIEYFKRGLYTVDDLSPFLIAGWITQEDYTELTKTS